MVKPKRSPPNPNPLTDRSGAPIDDLDWPPGPPRPGDTVIFHDPRDGKSYPAVVCHVDPAGTLDLHVLRPTDYNVPNAPGDFGHWGPVS